jgi:hypothetical protein
MIRIACPETLGRCPRALGLSATLLLGVLWAGVSTTGHAEVNVTGSLTATRVMTNQDAISDVLSAIAATLNVRYRTSVPLDGVVSGTYSGSFGQVISRLLNGYNYVIRHDGETVEIVVFGKHGERPVAVRPPSDPSSKKGIVSQWR